MLEFAKNGENQPKESSMQTRSKNISTKDTDSEHCYQKEESWSKKLPVENHSGSFNKITNLILVNVRI